MWSMKKRGRQARDDGYGKGDDCFLEITANATSKDNVSEAIAVHDEQVEQVTNAVASDTEVDELESETTNAAVTITSTLDADVNDITN